MDMFVIAGGTPLRGGVAVSGAKNAALPVMAAAIMADGPLALHNIPHLRDVSTMRALLESLGVRVSGLSSSLTLQVVDESPCLAHYELVRQMRAGVSVLGPLLAKRGRAIVSLPGGCNIGDRPIDLHLKGLRALGVEIRIERGYVIAEAERLKGTDIDLGGSNGSTVTGTCNVMSAAVLAEGTTVIESAACEPEVVDLGNCLNRMGANIRGLGTPFLTITGVKSLQGTVHEIIPDRIEAATLMIAAAVTGGCVQINNVRTEHLTSVLDVLREIGVTMTDHATKNAVTVTAPSTFHSVELSALPYPGIPTDVQAQLMSLLCIAEGMSVITDRVFPDRFMHAAELNRMGACIRRDGPAAVITGTAKLNGACVMASDLRASAALVIAALAAEGVTAIKRIYHLDRGYESLETKLSALGGNVRRIKDCPENLPTALRAGTTDMAAIHPLHRPTGDPRPRRRAS